MRTFPIESFSFLFGLFVLFRTRLVQPGTKWMKMCVPVEQIGLNVFKAQCLETGILSRDNPPYGPDTTSQELKQTEEFLRSRSTIAKYLNLHEAATE